MGETSKVIRCDTHGSVVWEGHLCCEECERVFDAAQGVPENCPCGVRLMPDLRRLSAVKFSGQPICPACYRARVQS